MLTNFSLGGGQPSNITGSTVGGWAAGKDAEDTNSSLECPGRTTQGLLTPPRKIAAYSQRGAWGRRAR